MDERKKNELNRQLQERIQNLEQGEKGRLSGEPVKRRGARYTPKSDASEQRRLFLAANSPDRVLIEEALGWLKRTYQKNRFDFSGVGDYLLDKFFNCDPRAMARDVIRDNVPFQYLLERCKSAGVPFMADWLAHAVRASALEDFVFNATGSDVLLRLTPGHKIVFLRFARMCDSPAAIKKLAEETLKYGWSVHQLAQAVQGRGRARR